MECQYCGSDNILFYVSDNGKDSDDDYTCSDCHEVGSFDRASSNHPDYVEDRIRTK